jgi:hypothetical protein
MEYVCLIVFLLTIIGIILLVVSMVGTANRRKKELSDMKQDFLAKGYQITREITHKSPLYGAVATALFDTHNAVLCVLSGKTNQPRYFHFSELLGFDVIVNRQTVSGGFGRTVTAGALFGPIGAILASQTGRKEMVDQFEAYIYTNNPNEPKVEVFKIDKPVRYNTTAFKQAIQFVEELQASINTIVEINRSHQQDFIQR